MTITASLVKELRDRTGAGMMECKRALTETNGNVEEAITNMRKSGLLKAAKKAGRTAAEGRITIMTNENHQRALMLEVNCETDFVANDDNFKAFCQSVAEHALQSNTTDMAAIAELAYNGGETIEHARTELVAKIGENIQLRRATELSSTGVVAHYVHRSRIGVMVALDTDNETLARDIAMHIAASNPVAIDESGVPAEVLEKEKEIFIAQAKESGKPDEIIEKMIQGRMQKYLKEVSLVFQPFLKSEEGKTVGAILKENNANVLAFVRYEVGEGIEKEEKDFAAEVAETMKGS